jgi:hypothetical protein
MKTMAAVCCFILLFSLSTQAEIEKNAVMCDTGICFYWWPKLPELKGWRQDKEMSFKFSANALAPEGHSFADAEAVMYATANYKPRMPETKSLAMFIAGDKEQFLSADPSLTITPCDALATGDGQKLLCFSYFPKSDGNWEQVSYGEEGDFYLVFTLSSRSKQGFDKTLAAYREMVSHYRAKP